MSYPSKKGQIPLRDDAEPFVIVGFVTRDSRRKLRHQVRMIELLFFAGLQIGFGTAHPKYVAMQNDLPVSKGAAVVSNESLQRERKQPVDAAVNEFFGAFTLLVQEMGPSAVSQNVFAPNHGITKQDDWL